MKSTVGVRPIDLACSSEQAPAANPKLSICLICLKHFLARNNDRSNRMKLLPDRKLCLVAEGPNKGLADLKELLEAGKLVPVIDRTCQLSEVSEAMRYFGEGRHKGKIVVTLGI